MILRLAWRSLWRQRRRTAITLSSIILGLALAVFFVAVGEGVYGQLIEQVVRMQGGHVTVEHPEYRDAPAVDLYLEGVAELRDLMEALPGVESTKLLILGQGVASSGAGGLGISLVGVEPSVEAETSLLARNIVEGRYLEEQGGSLVVVGKQLADRLELEVGRKLVLTTNDMDGALRSELCRVAGIFETGSEEVDAYVIQAPIEFARQLYGLPRESATQLGLILANPDLEDRVVEDARLALGESPAVALPWQEVMPEFAAFIMLDKGSNYVMQAVLLFLIMFTIFNTILMSVMERRREFSVLMALGTEPFQVVRQLLAETALLGLVGCGLGLLLGGLAGLAVQTWGLDLRALTGENLTVSGFAVSMVLRAKVTPGLLFWSGGLVFVATLILSFIPMRHALSVSLTDTLRG